MLTFNILADDAQVTLLRQCSSPAQTQAFISLLVVTSLPSVKLSIEQQESQQVIWTCLVLVLFECSDNTAWRELSY